MAKSMLSIENIEEEKEKELQSDWKNLHNIGVSMSLCEQLMIEKLMKKAKVETIDEYIHGLINSEYEKTFTKTKKPKIQA